MPETFPTNREDQYRRAIELGAAWLDHDITTAEFEKLCDRFGWRSLGPETSREFALRYCRRVLAGEEQI